MAYSTLTPLGSTPPSTLAAHGSSPNRLDGQAHSVFDAVSSTVRVTIDDPSGVVAADIVLAADTVADKWTAVRVAIHGNADSSVATRLNRLLKGFTLDGLPSSKPPVLRKYWRTKSMALGFKRKSVALPAAIVLRTNKKGTATYWSLVGGGSATGSKSPAAAAVPSTTAPVSEPKAKSTSSAPKTPAPAAKAAPTPSGVLPAGHPGIFRMLPKKAKFEVWQDASTKRKLENALAQHTAGERIFVVLRGPSGAGKTVSAMDLARAHNLPFWKVDVAGLRDFGDWAGYNQPTTKDGVMVMDYVQSQFIEAVRADGPYAGIPRLVLLDEITRVETPGALNATLPILDGTGSIYVADAKRSILIDPTVLFVGTANIGAAFSGAVTLDLAFVNRSTHTIPVDFPPERSEVKVLKDQTGVDDETAKRFVQVAKQTRLMASNGELPAGVSTRQLVAACNSVMAASPLTPLEAAESAFVDTYSDEGGTSSQRSKVWNAMNGVLRGYLPPSQRTEPDSPAGVTPSTATSGSTTTTTL